MDLVRVSAALTFVFTLLALLYWLSTRRNGASAPWQAAGMVIGRVLPFRNQGEGHPHALRLEQRLALSATHQLCLVQCGDQRILLCTYPQGCSVLPINSDESSTEGARLHAS